MWEMKMFIFGKMYYGNGKGFYGMWNLTMNLNEFHSGVACQTVVIDAVICKSRNGVKKPSQGLWNSLILSIF